jgi:hypothetical protein
MDDHPAQYKETMEESGGRLDEAEGAPAEDDA